MKKLLLLSLILVTALAFSVDGWAQAQQGAGTAITPTAATGVAATRCDSVTGTGAQTLTLQNPGPGLSAYITTLILYGELSAAVTPAAPIAFTSTNINGTSPTFGSVQLLASGNGGVVGPGVIPLIAPIKGLTNQAVTFAAASVTNITWRMTACYYFAP
jgi:hypothetical protein